MTRTYKYNVEKIVFSFHEKTFHWKWKLDPKQNGPWGLNCILAKSNMLIQSSTRLQEYLCTFASATHLPSSQNRVEWALHFPSLRHTLAAAATPKKPHVMVSSSFLNNLCNCWEWIYWFSLTTRQTIQSSQGDKICICWWCYSACYRKRITDSCFKCWYHNICLNYMRIMSFTSPEKEINSVRKASCDNALLLIL